MKRKYADLKFYGNALRVISQANIIIEKYQAMGYDLTLRQVYYRFVSEDLFTEKFSLVGNKWVKDPNGTINAEPNYKMLGKVISNGRLAGLIDWEAIVDRTRYLRKEPTWANPAEIIESSAHQFQTNLWADQPFYIEIWFEKDALLGIFERAAEKYRLPFFSCRGYGSDSELWRAAQRIAVQNRAGKMVRILHFGDHDPSGIDMTRDIEDRLDLFGAGELVVKRLALNMDQVEHYAPPPNPAKETDTRFADYRKNYGDESWELDALEPGILVDLVNQQVEANLNGNKWRKSLKVENGYKEKLRQCSDQWADVSRFLDEQADNA